MTWNSRINQFNVAHCQTLTTLCSSASHCCHKMNLTATVSRTPEAKTKTKQSVLLRKEKQVSWMFSHNSLHFFKVLHVSYLVLYAAHLSINCSML